LEPSAYVTIYSYSAAAVCIQTLYHVYYLLW